MTAAAYVSIAHRRLAGFSQRSRAAAETAAARAVLPGGWSCECALRTVTDSAVFAVRGPRGQAGVLKVATTESGMAGLRREREVLSRLGSDEQLGEWRALLPALVDAGEAGPGAFLLTNRLPGRNGRDLPRAAASRLTPAMAGAIAPLHSRTQIPRRVDEELLDQWVDQPAERIRTALPAGRTALCAGWAIGRLAGALRAGLAGRLLALGWAHGDLHPGNLLVNADGQVTGIVDWGGACEQDLPAVDLAFWLLAVGAPGQPREFGRRVAARLSSGRFWTAAESRLLDSAAAGGLAAGRTLLLMAWLRHVASNLAKSERYASNPLWLRWNVIPVLRQVAHE
jgi:Ser/Thr protein kinase RdoA (MazF antagonist)